MSNEGDPRFPLKLAIAHNYPTTADDYLSPQQRAIVIGAEGYIRVATLYDNTGHDWGHIHAVRNLAVCLWLDSRDDPAPYVTDELNTQYTGMPVNPFTLELSALLHERYDDKLKERFGSLPNVGEMLQRFKVDEQTIADVEFVARNIGFKGGENHVEMNMPAAMYVRDADRVEALGIGGILRTTLTGFNKFGRPFYIESIQEETKSNGSTLSHFHDKLYELPATVYTKAAKILADQRVKKMQQFEREYLDEVGAIAQGEVGAGRIAWMDYYAVPFYNGLTKVPTEERESYIEQFRQRFINDMGGRAEVEEFINQFLQELVNEMNGIV